jgi:hypothetical protein
MHSAMMSSKLQSSKTSMTGAAVVQRTNVPSNVKFVRNVPAGRKLAVRVSAEAPAAKGIETTGPNFTANKDIQAIMDILPHRYYTKTQQQFTHVEIFLKFSRNRFCPGYQSII